MWQLWSWLVFAAQFSPCVPPAPSSKVTNTAVVPALYAGLFTILSSQPLSHLSPTLTLQSCMSLHRLGVRNANDGNVSFCKSDASRPEAGVPMGTSLVLHVDVTSV